MSVYQLKLYRTSIASYTDMSDYIEEVSEIPIMDRSSDFTYTAKGYSFVITDEYPYYGDIASGKTVSLFVDGVIVQRGIVADKIRDYESNTTTVYIDNELMKMKNYKVHKDVLHSALSSELTYSGGVIPLVDALKVMFEVTGLEYSLVDTELRNNDSYVVKSRTITEVGGATAVRDFRFRELSIDVYMLYAINQSVQAGYDVIANAHHNEARITVFDFVVYILKIFQIGLIFHNGSYTLKWYGNASATDIDLPSYLSGLDGDNVDGYLSKNIMSDSEGYWRANFYSGERATFNSTSTPPTATEEVYNVGGYGLSADGYSPNINLYSNLVFLLQKTSSVLYQWDLSTTYINNALKVDDGIFCGFLKLYKTTIYNQIDVKVSTPDNLWLDAPTTTKPLSIMGGKIDLSEDERSGIITEQVF